MTEPQNIKAAMEAVVRAHSVLADFHREVAAFFRIADDLLAGEDGGVRLEPAPQNAQYAVIELPVKLVDAAHWAPGWYGRFYRNAEAHRDEQEEGADPALPEKLAVAFVMVAASPLALADMTTATLPECVAGLAHPGTGRAKDFWTTARYGVWHLLPFKRIAVEEWREGSFTEGTNVFGKGSYWGARRFPLSDLPDREAIKSKVTGPLLERFSKRFGGE